MDYCDNLDFYFAILTRRLFSQRSTTRRFPTGPRGRGVPEWLDPNEHMRTFPGAGSGRGVHYVVMGRSLYGERGPGPRGHQVNKFD